MNDDTMNDMPPSIESITEEATRRSGLNRRGFLGAAGAFSAAAFLAACGSSGGSDGTKSTTTAKSEMTTTTAASSTTAGSSGSASGDLKIGAFAASLEVLAVSTYGAALDAAKAGKLGTVPPAVAQFVTTAKAQHQEQLDAWNKALTAAGQKAVTDPPAALAKSVNDQFAKVTDVAGAAKLALSLEQAAAATYLAAIPEISTKEPLKLAASIQIIDMQHVAILLFALGKYPVPDTFASTKGAVSAS